MSTLLQRTLCSRTIYPLMIRKCQHDDLTQKMTSTICDSSPNDWMKYIKDNTEVSTDHLTPEISLNLITPNCALWHQPESESKFHDPFWAFYWPGGQALSRFILDNPNIVSGKRVLDVGCGCGASSIAAAMRGASFVLANDIDPVAIKAVQMNSQLNSVTITTSTDDLIGSSVIDTWDSIFLGDMFYDEEFTTRVHGWINTVLKINKQTSIFIGDPGRIFLQNHPLQKSMNKIFDVELTPVTKRENSGFSEGHVWEVVIDNKYA